MRINIIAVNSSVIPRKLKKCRSYRNLVGQILLGPCTSTSAQFDDRILEEDEEEMVEGVPADDLNESPSRELIHSERDNINGVNSDNNNNNNNNNISNARNIGWQVEDNEDSISDKEDDDEVEEANLENEPYDLIASSSSTNLPYTYSNPPQIKVTTDDGLLQMAQEYRENFDGFAEINNFTTIEEMHDFIKNTLEISPTQTQTTSTKQDLYLDILLNEPPENRFRRLFETSRLTVRQVLVRNEDILQELFASASLDDFPSPLVPIDDNGCNEDDEIYENQRDAVVEENMKRWYMIEMVGLWLKMITDIKTYRAAIKKSVLSKIWGIENDRYEGIAVPIKYK